MDKSFGRYIQKKREEMDLSIRKLADACGLSHAAVSMIERGKRKKPMPDTLQKLAKGLQIPYEQLLKEAGYLDMGGLPDYHRRFKNKSRGTSHSTGKESVDLHWVLGHPDVRFEGKVLNEEQKGFLELFLITLLKKDEVDQQTKKI